MTSSSDKSERSPRELADLSALADGTLPASRREEVQARISASPELSALYERERRIVEVMRHAGAVERAPAALRARIEAGRPSASSRARRRVSYAGALAGALAIVVLALVLILPAGTPGSPTLGQAAALALRGPRAPAPAPDPSAPSVKLGRDIEDVYFPNWTSRFGWRAIGQRSDRIGPDGRQAVTVYYRSVRSGWVLAYTIVGAPALRQPVALATRLEGTDLRTLRLGGRLVVTWRRDGHTCVLSAADVPASELQQLAAWKAPGLERS
jgi:hypothetical protein